MEAKLKGILMLSQGAMAGAFLFLLALQGLPGAVYAEDAPEDAQAAETEANYLHGIEPFAGNGSLHAVIEIPAGTNEKWELTRDGKDFKWDELDGKPRVVDYLSYPANYGMVPQTHLDKETGGDGDPLDVIVLGPARARGEVMEVKALGVMRLLDRGEIDDKIIAAVPDSQMGRAGSLDDLQRLYPGIQEILSTWFSHYKGPGKMSFAGWGSREEALDMIKQSHESYKRLIKPNPDSPGQGH